jgi:hypothetical protein
MGGMTFKVGIGLLVVILRDLHGSNFLVVFRRRGAGVVAVCSRSSHSSSTSLLSQLWHFLKLLFNQNYSEFYRFLLQPKRWSSSWCCGY